MRFPNDFPERLTDADLVFRNGLSVLLADPCSAFFGLFILWYFAGLVTQEEPFRPCRVWGLRVGYAVTVLYWLSELFRSNHVTANILVGIFLRGFYVGGLTMSAVRLLLVLLFPLAIGIHNLLVRSQIARELLKRRREEKTNNARREKQNRQETRRQAEAEAKHRAWLAVQPPPPTAAELVAKARVEAAKRIELWKASTELEPEDIQAHINAELDQLEGKLREILR